MLMLSQYQIAAPTQSARYTRLSKGPKRPIDSDGVVMVITEAVTSLPGAIELIAVGIGFC